MGNEEMDLHSTAAAYELYCLNLAERTGRKVLAGWRAQRHENRALAQLWFTKVAQKEALSYWKRELRQRKTANLVSLTACNLFQQKELGLLLKRWQRSVKITSSASSASSAICQASLNQWRSKLNSRRKSKNILARRALHRWRLAARSQQVNTALNRSQSKLQLRMWQARARVQNERRLKALRHAPRVLDLWRAATSNVRNLVLYTERLELKVAEATAEVILEHAYDQATMQLPEMRCKAHKAFRRALMKALLLQWRAQAQKCASQTVFAELEVKPKLLKENALRTMLFHLDRLRARILSFKLERTSLKLESQLAVKIVQFWQLKTVEAGKVNNQLKISGLPLKTYFNGWRQALNTVHRLPSTPQFGLKAMRQWQNKLYKLNELQEVAIEYRFATQAVNGQAILRQWNLKVLNIRSIKAQSISRRQQNQKRVFRRLLFEWQSRVRERARLHITPKARRAGLSPQLLRRMERTQTPAPKLEPKLEPKPDLFYTPTKPHRP